MLTKIEYYHLTKLIITILLNALFKYINPINLFRNIVRHCVENDGILPLKDEAYDVLSVTGGFFPMNINPSSAKVCNFNF